MLFFDDSIKFEDFDFAGTLIDEESHKIILIYDISYKALIDTKPLSIRFDKIDEFIGICDRNRYLLSFCLQKYNVVYNRIIQNICFKHDFSRYYTKFKGHSYDSLPVEKTFGLYNIIIHIKSVFYRVQNHYFYDIF